MTEVSHALDNILELASQLQKSTEGLTIHPDIKPIRLQLSELLEQTESLSTKDVKEDSRGTYLLAHVSNNPEHTEHAISMIDLNDFTMTLEDDDNDIGAYIRHTREQNIMAVIEARRREVEEDFRAFVQAKLASDWPSRKVMLLDHYKKQKKAPIEQESAKSELELQRSKWSSYRGDNSAADFDDVRLEEASQWSAKEQTFVQAISSLNEHRQIKQSVAIGSLMSQLTRTLGTDLRTHQLADAWHMLSFISNEKHVEHGKIAVGKLLHARQYAKSYAATEDSSEINQMVIEGSRRYLEDQFFSLVEREIARNPQQARLGGLPTIEGKIKAFVNLRLQKNGTWTMSNLEMVNNVPVWAVLFYFLRAGFAKEAAQYSVKNEMLFSKLEKNWCSYIIAYADDPLHNLPRPLSDRMHTEYNQRIKYGSENSDPFKQALFKIVGRCDLNHKTLSAILPVAEDWMWLQMTLLRETSQADARYERYRLIDLQEMLQHYGERHFNPKGGNPILYFQMLLLSGQFERAVHNLASKSWTDAVHFAIVLAYYGLVRVTAASKNAKSLLIEDDNIVRLSFAQLIEAYIMQIRSKSVTAAVEYATLICMNADLQSIGKSHVDASHAVLRSLILETRDFTTLLGDIRPDGTRDAGYIEKRLDLLGLNDEKQYLRTITEQAAAVSEREGRMADAILLYHLSEEYDVVVNLINNFLGAFLLEHSFVATRKRESLAITTSEDAPTLAKNMLSLYKSNASILATIGQSNLESCRMLLAIVESRDQFQTGNYSGSLATIDLLSLFPMGDNVSVGMIKNMANNFNLLDESVARNVPNLLLLTIKCFKAKYDVLNKGDYNDQSRKLQIQAIKLRVRNLNTFAGLIKYQMSEEVRIAFENEAASIR